MLTICRHEWVEAAPLVEVDEVRDARRSWGAGGIGVEREHRAEQLGTPAVFFERRVHEMHPGDEGAEVRRRNDYPAVSELVFLIRERRFGGVRIGALLIEVQELDELLLGVGEGLCRRRLEADCRFAARVHALCGLEGDLRAGEAEKVVEIRLRRLRTSKECVEEAH